MLELVKYLHLLTMIVAVTAAVIPGLVLLVIARRRDVAALRGLAPLAISARGFAAPLFVLGAIFGLAATVAARAAPMRPWLIASYVAFILALLTGAILGDPWARQVGRAAVESPGDTPSPEMEAAIRDRRGTIASAVMVGSVAVLIFLAAIKPGG